MSHGAKCNCFLCNIGKALGLIEEKKEVVAKKVSKKTKKSKKK